MIHWGWIVFLVAVAAIAIGAGGYLIWRKVQNGTTTIADVPTTIAPSTSVGIVTPKAPRPPKKRAPGKKQVTVPPPSAPPEPSEDPIISSSSTTLVPRAPPAPASAPGDGSFIFAPYVMPGSEFIRSLMDLGGRNVTIAFMNWLGGKMSWDSGDPDRDTIDQLRSKGGDMVISCGGAEGCSKRTEPGLIGGSPDEIFQRYKSGVDAWQAKYMDFDIEMGTESDAGTYPNRNLAFKKLNDAYPDLKLSFTLPCDPSGIGGALNMIKDAAAKGVKFNCVRVMTFDYGNGSGDLVKDTISCLTNTYKQCKDAGLQFDGVGWIGMINKDDNGRGHSTDDTRKIMQWVRGDGKGIVNTVSYWVLNSDNGMEHAKLMIP